MTRFSRTALSLGLTFVSATVAYWYWSSGSPATDTRSSACAEQQEHEEFTSLAEPLSSRAAHLIQATPSGMGQQPVAPEGDDDDHVTPPEEDSTIAEMESAAREREEAVHASLEVAFGTAAPPRQVDRSREASLREAMTSRELPAGTRLDDLECRSGSCRATLTVADELSDRLAFRRLMVDPETSVARDMTVYVPSREVNEDGSVTATVYFVPADFVPPV